MLCVCSDSHGTDVATLVVEPHTLEPAVEALLDAMLFDGPYLGDTDREMLTPSDVSFSNASLPLVCMGLLTPLFPAGQPSVVMFSVEHPPAPACLLWGCFMFNDRVGSFFRRMKSNYPVGSQAIPSIASRIRSLGEDPWYGPWKC